MLLGLSPTPQPRANGTSCIPGTPGAGLAWWCPSAITGAQHPSPPSPAVPCCSPAQQGLSPAPSTVLRWVLTGWEVSLDAAAGCSAYIRWLLIALKIFKD